MTPRRLFPLLAVLLTAIPVTAATAASTATPKRYVVTSVDFGFRGIPRTLRPGTYTFVLVNRGAAPHDLRIAGKKTRLLGPGRRQAITVRLRRGSYTYVCTVPGHSSAGMRGRIVVR